MISLSYMFLCSFLITGDSVFVQVRAIFVSFQLLFFHYKSILFRPIFSWLPDMITDYVFRCKIWLNFPAGSLYRSVVYVHPMDVYFVYCLCNGVCALKILIIEFHFVKIQLLIQLQNPNEMCTFIQGSECVSRTNRKITNNINIENKSKPQWL